MKLDKGTNKKSVSHRDFMYGAYAASVGLTIVPEIPEAEDDKTDAVYCGTPDHSHAVISNASLKKDKYLCCVKPLTRTIFESRILSEAARQTKVATQVTASSNTKDSACRLCEVIRDGENMKFTNGCDTNKHVK